VPLQISLYDGFNLQSSYNLFRMMPNRPPALLLDHDFIVPQAMLIILSPQTNHAVATLAQASITGPVASEIDVMGGTQESFVRVAIEEPFGQSARPDAADKFSPRYS